MSVLKEINIYPIKSMGRVSLKESLAQIRGFQYDRRMMLTDGKGNFMSQRKYPEMARFSISLASEGFLVHHEGVELTIPFNLKPRSLRQVTIWEDRLIAPEVEGHFSKWFSDHLNVECHLIMMDEYTERPVKKKYAIHDETVSFADGFPYLIIGSASLDDLNTRLKVPVPMDRFRPNLVISTEESFFEDGLEHFRIGEAVFKRIKPCARCIVTTTDQDTGKRNKEPLKTLAAYRTVNNKVFFGQNLICLREGSVKTGDELDLNVNYSDM